VPRTAPIERIRARLAAGAGSAPASLLPRGYQRVGRAVLVRLPSELEEHFPQIGRMYAEELGADCVLAFTGAVAGEFRRPQVRRIYGETSEVVHRELGLRWHLDAQEILWAAGNRAERQRVAELVRPGEKVVDLFAGIGYFALPAALHGRAARVDAVEKNPRAYFYLRWNIEENGLTDRVVPHWGDNREVPLPPGEADRAFLGFLPSALPFLGGAARTLQPGGWVHVHLVVHARPWREEARHAVEDELSRQGIEGDVERIVPVKPYGPGRTHVVVDVRLGGRPGGEPAEGSDSRGPPSSLPRP